MLCIPRNQQWLDFRLRAGLMYNITVHSSTRCSSVLVYTETLLSNPISSLFVGAILVHPALQGSPHRRQVLENV